MMSRILLAIALITVVSIPIQAQDVCVLDTMKVQRNVGIVTQADSQRIPGAEVQLFKQKKSGGPVAKVRTDDRGNFAFSKVRTGSYILKIRAQNYVRLVVSVKVWGEHANKPRSRIHVVLGTNYNEICGGGDVALKPQ